MQIPIALAELIPGILLIIGVFILNTISFAQNTSKAETSQDKNSKFIVTGIEVGV